MPTNVSLGSGDSDAFGYDIMGRMNSYQYNVGSQTISGVPYWNPNGTLGQVAITDPIDSSNQQTCNYSHDDLMRIASVNCGTIWDQAFSYDPFGNISKTGVSGAESWQPSYNTSTNQYSSVPTGTATYDANGNVTSDGFRNYTWDADGNLVAAGPEACPGQFCQYGGNTTRVFDALDRSVEENYNSGQPVYQEAYGPTGPVAIMNGQSLFLTRLPLPGGGIVAYAQGTSGPTTSRWYHPDWQGSIRLNSDSSHNVYNDEAYAPFGEEYGWTQGETDDFTGQLAATQLQFYDFPYREYHSIQGRWLSPDPAGLGAVNPANPQSWNRYAYALNNPLVNVDPLGLDAATACGGFLSFNGITTCPFSASGGVYGGWDEFQYQDIPVVIGTAVWVPPLEAGIENFSANPEYISDTVYSTQGYLTWIEDTVGNAFMLFGGQFNSSPFEFTPASGGGTSSRTAPQNPVPGCLGQAIKAKGLSIALDGIGSVPGLGNLVSGTAGTARAIDDVVTYGGGAAGVAMGLPDETPYGAASAGAGLGLAFADVSVGGTTWIPIAGNAISVLSGAYDIYGASKAYHACTVAHQ